MTNRKCLLAVLHLIHLQCINRVFHFRDIYTDDFCESTQQKIHFHSKFTQFFVIKRGTCPHNQYLNHFNVILPVFSVAVGTPSAVICVKDRPMWKMSSTFESNRIIIHSFQYFMACVILSRVYKLRCEMIEWGEEVMILTTCFRALSNSFLPETFSKSPAIHMVTVVIPSSSTIKEQKLYSPLNTNISHCTQLKHAVITYFVQWLEDYGQKKQLSSSCLKVPGFLLELICTQWPLY